MTTRDTPEAALAAALRSCGLVSHIDSDEYVRSNAAAILAAMPDWTLVPKGRLDRLVGIEEWEAEKIDLLLAAEAEIARLRAALEEISGDEFTYPMGGPAQTMADIASAALAPSEP